MKGSEAIPGTRVRIAHRDDHMHVLNGLDATIVSATAVLVKSSDGLHYRIDVKDLEVVTP